MAVRIPLPDGKEAIISDRDKALAKLPWRWSQGYVICSIKQYDETLEKNIWVVLRLQRLVLPDEPDKHIYFKDGNPLNCQRSNLTTRYTNRPGGKTGRKVGDSRNDGGWGSRRRRST